MLSEVRTTAPVSELTDSTGAVGSACQVKSPLRYCRVEPVPKESCLLLKVVQLALDRAPRAVAEAVGIEIVRVDPSEAADPIIAISLPPLEVAIPIVELASLLLAIEPARSELVIDEPRLSLE
jgi:hypothetical protein